MITKIPQRGSSRPEFMRNNLCVAALFGALVWMTQGLPAQPAPSPDDAAPQSSGAPAGDIEEETRVRNVSDDYQLVPQDKVRYEILEDPVGSVQISGSSETASATELVVSSLGLMDFPVSQGYAETIQIMAKGKTLSQIKQELTRKLEEKYYHKATVEIQLISQSPRLGSAFFIGSVKGKISLRPQQPVTVSEAIMELGYDEFANLKKVTIQRYNAETGAKKEIKVNVDEIIFDNQQENDVILKDGDRVHVPERSFVF